VRFATSGQIELGTSLAVPPRNANAGRGGYFRGLVFSRPGIYALVLGCSATLVYGAYRGQPLLIVGGPVVVAALAVSVCWLVADRVAAHRFFAAFAESQRLIYVGRSQVPAFTPLLGAGDRQWCEHWMTGEVAPAHHLQGGLGHFVYEIRERRDLTSDDDVVRERHRVTLCVVDIEASLPLFKGVFLHPRRGLVGHRTDWVRGHSTREIEVESTEFTARYKLRLSDEQDEGLARQLLAPTLVSLLATHPLSPAFELRAGTLTVFVERVLEDAGNLTFFLEAARDLAGRVVKEVDELAAARRPLPASVAPPGLS
jgi:hypothetical protein